MAGITHKSVELLLFTISAWDIYRLVNIAIYQNILKMIIKNGDTNSTNLLCIQFPLRERVWMQYFSWLEEHQQWQHHLSPCEEWGHLLFLLENCTVLSSDVKIIFTTNSEWSILLFLWWLHSQCKSLRGT